MQRTKEELSEPITNRKYETQDKGAVYLILLDNILECYRDTINEQAERRPDTLMRLTQIRTINEILKELRNLFAGTETEDSFSRLKNPS